MSLVKRLKEGGAWAEIWCMCTYFRHSFISARVCMCCCVRASQRRARLSVISWHGLFWQRNKPPWPMITPTANRHLCMGEAWLVPQIALTPSVSVCANMHAGFGTVSVNLRSFSRTRGNLQVSMQAHVCVGLCTSVSIYREPWTVWILILNRIFKHWAPDPDTPQRVKP